MTSSPTQTMALELRTAPARFQAALVALATKNYAEASRHLRRLSQLNTALARKGLDEIEVSQETELSLETAVLLAALMRLWHDGPGGQAGLHP